MTKIIPESEEAKNSTAVYRCRVMAHCLNLTHKRYGDSDEWGWLHPSLPLNVDLFISELDCIWAGLQAIADFLAREGFEGKGERS